ncbi:MAG: type II toxin-antitoxin system prevent-host-death family antitoxin [Puniceicoccales bacterium]|nr:type II toxin-antitoxin system prevent-host-death family antitoxin [Puniceicoccales bacterium]
MNTETITIGVFDAKTRLSELLESVGTGATCIITKHDRPVARLIGYEDDARKRRVEATKKLRKLRQHYKLNGLNARQLREDGRA